jgi:type II secretory pathway pseudopilin PulG
MINLRRLEEGNGQGLVEVLVVVAFFSALVAVAIPSYLGFQGRKADKAAQEHLRAAIPAADAFGQDHRGFARLDTVALLRIDPRLSYGLSVAWAKRGKYCLTETVSGKTWSVAGPLRGRDPKFEPNGSCG